MTLIEHDKPFFSEWLLAIVIWKIFFMKAWTRCNCQPIIVHYFFIVWQQNDGNKLYVFLNLKNSA